MSAEILAARVDLLIAARSSVDYCREQDIDWVATEAATGGVFLAGIAL